jgi:2-polyprenyl-3-methyl-5-hydroxy-6-metoxy-1,4-benzoquinol methylase
MILNLPHADHPVDRYFDQVADTWIRNYSQRAAFQIRLSTIGPIVNRAVLDSKSGRVLDLGGGPGVFSAVASTHATMVVLLDRSSNMLLAGLHSSSELSLLVNRISGQYRPQQIHRVAGDLMSLGRRATEFFDIVMAISVLEYLDDIPEVIRHLSLTLKPGGTMILQVPNPQSPWRRARRILNRAEWVVRIVNPSRQLYSRSYMAIRPYGDRLPWEVSLRDNDIDTVAITAIPHGHRSPVSWFHPNLVVVAKKRESPPMSVQSSGSPL